MALTDVAAAIWSAIQPSVLRLAGFSIGVNFLVAMSLVSVTAKRGLRKLTTADKKQLALDRDKIWNLSKNQYNLDHDFCNVGDGDTKLHYVRSVPPSGITSETSLVIFFHGFPDSWHLWKEYLVNTQIASKAVLIAADLPGFGGSDSLAHYGPNEVLTILADFILQMRDAYLAPPSSDTTHAPPRVLIVAHDWGALLAFRLASEAPQLADRFIVSNAAHPSLLRANISARLATAQLLLRTWLRSPRNTRLLAASLASLKPILAQTLKSGYVFTMRLPAPLTPLLGALGDAWFLRLANAVAAGEPDPVAPARSPLGYALLAGTAGPGPAECDAPAEHGSAVQLAYGASVRARAPSAGWMAKTALYRDGCFGAPWAKPLALVVALAGREERRASGSGLGSFGPSGALRAPVTLLWGADDVAAENALMLEGVADFLMRGSHVVRIEGCGHWAPVHPRGVPVFEAVIGWALDGETRPLGVVLGEQCPMAVVATEK